MKYSGDQMKSIVIKDRFGATNHFRHKVPYRNLCFEAEKKSDDASTATCCLAETFHAAYLSIPVRQAL